MLKRSNVAPMNRSLRSADSNECHGTPSYKFLDTIEGFLSFCRGMWSSSTSGKVSDTSFRFSLPDEN